ncbi:MAG: hypothetical protein QW334_00350 [Thermofilum sp.]
MEKEVRKAEKIVEDWKQEKIRREDIEEYIIRLAEQTDYLKKLAMRNRLTEAMSAGVCVIMAIITFPLSASWATLPIPASFTIIGLLLAIDAAVR